MFSLSGLSFAKDCAIDVQNGVGSPKSKSTSIQKDNASSFGEHGIENESAYTHSEDDLARSPPGSPGGRTSLESPSQELSNNHFRKSSEADTEIHRYGACRCLFFSLLITCSSIVMALNLTLSGNRSFDEPNWEPSFDHNDDTDSIWGFNPSTTKVSQNFQVHISFTFHLDICYTEPSDVQSVNVGQDMTSVWA